MTLIMKIDDKTGLVLEGGGMRGVFTCGVLDYLMDNEIWFSYGVGVSAGGCVQRAFVYVPSARACKIQQYRFVG